MRVPCGYPGLFFFSIFLFFLLQPGWDRGWLEDVEGGGGGLSFLRSVLSGGIVKPN
jgi:hypothetical protein